MKIRENKISKHLLGQGLWPQPTTSEDAPEQGFPPYCGVGVLQILVRLFVADVPQVAVQAAQALHLE